MILVTGFPAFGPNSINPTELIIRSLKNKNEYSETHDFLLLPVDYDLGPQTLIERLRSKNYKAWLGFGQAGGRSKISLERVAINWKERDFNLATEESFLPKPLVENKPAAFINSDDLNKFKQILIDEKIPTEISLTAGSYVCNAVYYYAMSEGIKSLFVHFPYIPTQNQVNQPTLSLEQEVRAAEILIKNFS